MPKRIFRKYLPTPEHLKQHRSLHFLGEVLADPNLWHINRHSLAGAAFIGIFCGLLPLPLQMALAALLAVRFHCNLPLSVVLVWISNPITYVPIFYFNYRVGTWLLGMEPVDLSSLTVDQVFARFFEVLFPLSLGSVLISILCGGLAWVAIKLVWRLAVIRSWNLRAKRRRKKASLD